MPWRHPAWLVCVGLFPCLLWGAVNGLLGWHVHCFSFSAMHVQDQWHRQHAMLRCLTTRYVAFYIAACVSFESVPFRSSHRGSLLD